MSSRRGLSVGARRRPVQSDTASDLRREEAMERLYERIEASARRKVVKAAKNYRLVSFSNVSILFSCRSEFADELYRKLN
jgi:hypothetical protein